MQVKLSNSLFVVLKEFHEIPFLKKFKFKRQDRVFPKEPPAAPAAAPASSAAASASASAASSTSGSGFPTELPTEVPTGQSLHLIYPLPWFFCILKIRSELCPGDVRRISSPV